MTKRTKQIIWMAAVVVLAIFTGGSLYVYNWLKNSVPPASGVIAIPGLDHKIDITYDSMGIPQVWAETEHDGYFAMGYLHASDRMFQMDMARRMSQGRLSELLGDVTLESDKRQRMVGHNRIARAALKNLSEENKARLQAYADGVNACKKIVGAPQFEYLLLGGTFEDWTNYDCLALLSFQTWYSDALQNHDKFYREVVEKIKPGLAASFCFDYPDWGEVTVPPNKKVGYYRGSNLPFKSETVDPYSMTRSSNSWVIAPSNSKSRHAMLAADPHLHTSQLPQFWYMMGLHVKETNLNVLGITTPGLPFVIMGHNGQAAWSFTAGGVQVTKNYQERINPTNANEYQVHDGWKTFDRVTDTINVSGESKPVVLETKLTKHGPVIPESEQELNATSLHWAGYDIDLSQAVESGFKLQKTNSFEKFRQTVTTLGALNANWMYADSAGNIGYQLGTPIFDPQINNSSLPLPGWNDLSNWQEFYPAEKNPFSKNPAQGWLASSNNLATRSKEFPHLTGTFEPDRIMRISEILRNRTDVDVPFIQRIQRDRIDAYLRRWRGEVSRLLNNVGQNELSELIKNWNGQTSIESKETAIMVVFLSQLKKLTFEDELGDLYKGVRTVWLDQIYHDTSQHFWFDNVSTPRVETSEEIAREAISKTVEIVGDKTWGDMNSFQMQHPMANVPILGSMLDLRKEKYKWPGTSGTLNASFFITVNDSTFKTIVGPSWRFIIDFANVDSALFVLPAGNSGNPMSEHFFDFNPLWQNVQYWNVPLSEDLVRSKAASVLTFEPQAADSSNREN